MSGFKEDAEVSSTRKYKDLLSSAKTGYFKFTHLVTMLAVDDRGWLYSVLMVVQCIYSIDLHIVFVVNNYAWEVN